MCYFFELNKKDYTDAGSFIKTLKIDRTLNETSLLHSGQNRETTHSARVRADQRVPISGGRLSGAQTAHSFEWCRSGYFLSLVLQNS